VQAEDQHAQPAALPVDQEWVLPKRPGAASNIWKFIRRKPLGAFGVLIVLVMISMTLGTPKAEFGTPDLPSRPLGFELGQPWMARYDAEKTFKSVGEDDIERIDTYVKPSGQHWLGTDRGGRDTYSRVVFAARRSLFIGLWALTFAVVVGTAVGVISAYFGGWSDTLIQRLMDSFQAFPALLILILLISLRPPSLTVLAVGLGFVGVTSVQRIVRGVVLSTREQPYVEAARVVGATDLRTMVVHILPNIMAPIIVVFSIGLGSVILAEAAISFIAANRVPQDPSWGRMLNVTREFLPPEPEGYHTLAAGGAIILAVLGFNLAGDALRDVLDPRLRVG
jgi:ABC-type dipeptide/oligopeptide/nickel transport system permease subunit